MKKLLIAAAVVIAAFNSAWIYEGADNNCAAYEVAVAGRVAASDPDKSNAATMGRAFAGALIRASNGRFAAAMAKEQFPSLPTPVACNLVYWYVALGGPVPPKVN
jgi:hypothetical protein